jgi:RHS repeat-associated protein
LGDGINYSEYERVKFGSNYIYLHGWKFVTSADDGVANFNYWPSYWCSADSIEYWDTFGSFTWTDPNGTVHAFPIKTVEGYNTSCGNFTNKNQPSGDALALDSSGYHMYVTNFTSVAVYSPDGTQAYTDRYIGTKNPIDTNGNYFLQDSNSNVSDTLGRTLVTTTSSGSTITFTVKTARGTSTFTATVASINVNTNFHALDSLDFDVSGSINVISAINLPDGTSYTFGYDSGTSSGHYGQLTSMTLPTLATISYTYSNIVDSEYYNTTRKHITRGIYTRTTPDSSTPWTYTPAVVTACSASKHTDCIQTFTVVKPNGDNTVYTFDVNGGVWPIEVDYKNGSSTLLATLTQSFDFSHTCTYTGTPYYLCNFWQAMNVTKLSATTTLPIPSSVNVHQTTQFCYDINYGNLSYKWEWNFYTTAIVSDPHPPGYPCSATATPDRTTSYSYLAAYTGTEIHNRPSSITVTTGSTTVAKTLYAYDGSTLASATRKSQHDDTHYPTTYTYRGNATEVQQLVSGTSNYLNTYKTFDMTGQVVTSTDSNTNSTSFGYADNFFTDGGDASNPSSYSPSTPTNAYLNTITHPTVNSVTLVDTFGYYWGTGQVALSTDPNSETTYFHNYDPLSRPTSVKLPNSGWTYFTYPSATQVDTGTGITSTSESVSCTGSACRGDQTNLDGLGRLSSKILESDPDGATTVGTNYDSSGRVYSVSNPHRSSSLPSDGTEYYAYDGMDRITQVTKADGSIEYVYYGAAVSSYGGLSSLTCSGHGYPILYKDEASHLRQTWTDGFGRLIEVDEPNTSGSLSSGVDTCYTYDLNNNLTGVTEGSQTRSFSYDMLSRLTEASNPESGTICYYYTTSGGTCGVASSGTLCSGDPSEDCRRTDARSKTTTYAYDALNRLTSKSYSDTTPGVAYGYDAVAPSGCTPPTLTITNGKGRRTSMCDGPGGTAWSFDQVGNALTEKRTTNSVTDSFTYAYNLDSTVATVVYPSTRTITYQPGGAQRPLSGEDTTNSINYATSAHYFPPGELGSLANGSSISFTAITNNRVQPCWLYATTGTALSWNSTLCTTTETTAGNILDLEYGFNFGSSDNGNVMGITNNRDNTRSETFTYDALNRIKTGAASTYAVSPANCWGESYMIDRYGNLSAIGSISTAYTGCIQDSLSISISGSTNQITTSGFTYDLSGDLTSDGTYSPTYDAEGHMISDASVTYSYDGDGKRVQKSSGTLYWYGTSTDPMQETNGSGVLTNEYIFFNGKRIARRDSSGNVEYYVADHLGTARVVTNATGGVLEACDYFPYGRSNCSPSSYNNYLFTGKERDSESGLDNFGARYYSSQYGRFMTSDPGNVGADPLNPQSWNMYSYVQNNPLNNTDPSGKCSKKNGSDRASDDPGA